MHPSVSRSRRLAGCALAIASFAFAHPARAADVRFESSEPHLALHYRTSASTTSPLPYNNRYAGSLARTPVYESICPSLPCAAALRPGAYAFAVSRPDGQIVPVEGAPVPIEGSTRLTVQSQITDRSGWRIAGLVTTLGSVALGAGLLAMAQGSDTKGPEGEWLVYPGVGVLALGVTAGLFIMLQSDQASFTIAPASLGSRESGVAAASALSPNGAVMKVRF